MYLQEAPNISPVSNRVAFVEPVARQLGYAVSPVLASPYPKHYINRTGWGTNSLTRAGTQLTELRREADGLSRAGPTDTDAAARLRTIEAAGNALTASVGTMLKRIAILERELAEAAAPQPQLAPHNATTELPVREGQS